MPSSSLESQLAKIFKAGLASDPSTAKSLAAAIGKLGDQGGKSTKAECNYHTAYDSGKECGTCEHFDGNSGCEIVSGHVSADGVCDYWTSGSSNADVNQEDTSAEES